MRYERIGADGPFTHRQWWLFLREIYRHYDKMTLAQGKLAAVLQDIASEKMIFMKKTQKNGYRRGKLWVEGDNGARRFVTVVVDSKAGGDNFIHPVTALRSDPTFRTERIHTEVG